MSNKACLTPVRFASFQQTSSEQHTCFAFSNGVQPPVARVQDAIFEPRKPERSSGCNTTYWRLNGVVDLVTQLHFLSAL